MINNTVMARKTGQMGVIIKVIIMKGKNTEKGSLNSKIRVFMKAISLKMS